MVLVPRQVYKSADKGGHSVGLVPSDHQYLIRQVLGLRARAKRLVNGPQAYRGAAFAAWRKDTAAFFQRVNQTELSTRFESRFHRREFGKNQQILTEEQIYASFKRDMLETIVDFQQIFMAYKKYHLIADRVLSISTRRRTIGHYPFSLSTWRWTLISCGLIVLAVVLILLL